MIHTIVFWFSLSSVFNGTLPDFNRDGRVDLADLRLSQIWCEQVQRIIARVPEFRRFR
jgi:hypothetical protein